MADYVDISTLRNWSDNPRGIKEDKFQELKHRIREYGQIKPLIVTPDGEVLGGNMRLRAMRDLKIDKVWVSVVEPKTEADKVKIALTDNEEMGYYEDQALAELIAKFKDEIDLTKYSVHLGDPIDLDELLAKFSEEPVEDEVPEVTEEPVSVLGEVYQLGRHRVMCGDSTKIEDVEKLMDGKKADMVFTDPPYGMDLDTDFSGLNTTTDTFGKKESKKYSRVIGDDKPFNIGDFDWIDCNEQFWFGADWYKESLPTGGSWFVWDKRVDEALDDMFGSSFELCWSKQKHKRDIVRVKFSGVFGTEKQDIKKRMHPTQKPLELCSWFINKYSKADNLILDLFLGSGSTLIACEQTNRTCYGMELDPRYVDVCRRRYWKFTHDNDEAGWQEGTKKV